MDIESTTDHTACLKVALRILAKWQCSQSQIQKILNNEDIAKHTDNFHAPSNPLTEDQIERISHVLNIHASLVSLFSNEANIYGFVKFGNRNVPFNGRTPLSLIENGELSDLHRLNQEIAKISQLHI